MNCTVLFIIFIALNIVAMMVGRIPEVGKLPEFLNFKPFNCRLCLSTHSCWILHTIVALTIQSWIYFIFGVIAAICVYCLINHEENKIWEK